ncbi:MAG: PQ-loop repeat-containing protein [Polyangiaceae bacterium]
MKSDWIGWLSSGILIVTLVHQIRKQWREGRSEGVSPWLFVGQFVASLGFAIYSALVHNWVFTVTNGILVLNAALGSVITAYHRAKSRRDRA